MPRAYNLWQQTWLDKTAYFTMNHYERGTAIFPVISVKKKNDITLSEKSGYIHVKNWFYEYNINK